MLDKLRDNPRAVVAALVAAGVLAIAVGASSNTPNNTAETEATKSSEVSQEQSEESASSEQAPASGEAAQESTSSTEAAEPANMDTVVSGPLNITKDQGSLKATVRKGDSQTLIVRQMIANQLSTSNDSLSSEQRLYVETMLVSKLPKRDLIYPGEFVVVSESNLTEVIASSKNLDDAAIARWGMYL